MQSASQRVTHGAESKRGKCFTAFGRLRSAISCAADLAAGTARLTGWSKMSDTAAGTAFCFRGAAVFALFAGGSLPPMELAFLGLAGFGAPLCVLGLGISAGQDFPPSFFCFLPDTTAAASLPTDDFLRLVVSFAPGSMVLALILLRLLPLGPAAAAAAAAAADGLLLGDRMNFARFAAGFLLPIGSSAQDTVGGGGGGMKRAGEASIQGEGGGFGVTVAFIIIIIIGGGGHRHSGWARQSAGGGGSLDRAHQPLELCQVLEVLHFDLVGGRGVVEDRPPVPALLHRAVDLASDVGQLVPVVPVFVLCVRELRRVEETDGEKAVNSQKKGGGQAVDSQGKAVDRQ